MLEELRSDKIVAFLLERSNFTAAQLDTILASVRQGSLDKRRFLRERGVVSKGSFSRTLGQAHRNVHSAVYTLLLLEYLHLIPDEKITQLSRTGRMLSQLRAAEPSEGDIAKIVAAMEEFGRGFSVERKVIL